MTIHVKLTSGDIIYARAIEIVDSLADSPILRCATKGGYELVACSSVQSITF